MAYLKARGALCGLATVLLLCCLTSSARAARPSGCPPGTGGPDCQACAQGSWASGGRLNSACTQCNDGYTTVSTGSKRKTDCSVCARGYASPKKTGKFTCAACPIGSYSTGGASKKSRSTCAQCPTEFTTASPGSAHCSVAVCAAGSTRSADGATCIPCARGTWAPASDLVGEQPSCQACPAATTTALGAAAASADNCTVTACLGDSPAVYKTRSLNEMECMPANTCLLSPSGRGALCMQLDGDLVLYGYKPTAPGTATECSTAGMVKLWSSGSSKRVTGGKFDGHLCMQADGNLVVVMGSGFPIWASLAGTVIRSQQERPFNLQVNDDCQTATYLKGGVPYWATGTDGKCPRS